MEPRHYVHLGPKPAEEVSCIWRAAHIVVFVLLIGSSSVATVCVYNILDMYKFNCIIYAKMSFEKRYEDRFKNESNSSEAAFGSAVRNGTAERLEGSAYDLQALSAKPSLDEIQDWNLIHLSMEYRNGTCAAHAVDVSFCISSVYAPHMIYILLMPCLCAFMMVLSFIASNLFHKGLGSFCLRYSEFTKTKSCSKLMDGFNVQFSPGRKGPPKPFYKNYHVGGYALQVTSALWVLQSLVYLLRISCLADFTLYLTSIEMKNDDVPDPKMAGIASKQLDSKNKRV